MNKDTIQEDAVNLSNKHKALILEWGTNLGKSRAFIKIHESLKAEKVLVVVAERLHINNWKTEYVKYNSKLLNGVTFVCYQSLSKYVNEKFDLICLDEVHWLTPNRIKFLKLIKFTNFVGLSATLSYKTRDLLYSFLPTYYVDTISLSKAIDENLVPAPRFYLHKLNITKLTQKHSFVIKRGHGTLHKEIAYSQYKSIALNSNFKHLKLTVHSTVAQHLEYLDNTIDYYKKAIAMDPSSTRIAIYLNRLGLERKKLLGVAKTEYVKSFLCNFNKKYICFCTNIEQANYLSSETAIHSKNNTNDQVLSDFNNDKIDNIFAVKMLQEGINLSGIEASVIVQLDSTTRSFIQKTGRALRSKDTPEIHIFYFEGTSDERYLNNAVKGVNEDLITYIE